VRPSICTSAAATARAAAAIFSVIDAVELGLMTDSRMTLDQPLSGIRPCPRASPRHPQRHHQKHPMMTSENSVVSVPSA
jgi:hypothetical protein